MGPALEVIRTRLRDRLRKGGRKEARDRSRDRSRHKVIRGIRKGCLQKFAADARKRCGSHGERESRRKTITEARFVAAPEEVLESILVDRRAVAACVGLAALLDEALGAGVGFERRDDVLRFCEKTK